MIPQSLLWCRFGRFIYNSIPPTLYRSSARTSTVVSEWSGVWRIVGGEREVAEIEGPLRAPPQCASRKGDGADEILSLSDCVRISRFKQFITRFRPVALFHALRGSSSTLPFPGAVVLRTSSALFYLCSVLRTLRSLIFQPPRFPPSQRSLASVQARPLTISLLMNPF